MINARTTRLLVLCVAILTLASFGRGADNKDAAVLLTVENRVEVAPKGTQAWKPAHTNQLVAIGDFLRTGIRSRATLRLSDASILRVNELTSMEIEPPRGPGKPAEMNLQSGATYFFNREQPTGIGFRSPQASGAIRGTEFYIVVTEGKTVVTLLDGEVALENPQGVVTLRSGEEGTAEAGKAPTKSPVLNAMPDLLRRHVQWALYYPAVVDQDELGLTDAEKDALSASLTAYREGDLLAALSSYPENRQPGSDAEKIFRAALLLSVGRVDQTEALLGSVARSSPQADALREVMAAVKGEKFPGTSQPATGSEWVAHSYYLQGHSDLEEARRAAREATLKSPKFGAAWVRLAEMEFGFGRTPEALDALNRGLELSPRNAQGLALKGFLLSAQSKFAEAGTYFDKAIAVDGALGNAWLGRGLVKIRTGDPIGGRTDLQTAVTLEPNRSLLRSYLGKTYSYTWDNKRAAKELKLATDLDENDPTPWLYTALVYQEGNRINEAVYNIKRSQELNNNRSIFRSRLLLDQDQAVRSANLASAYRDVGMIDQSTREASRAVNYDYANYSAHLFLAESYDALRDPRLINLRYETPWLSELLVADLLAPANSANLSPSISQQDYSRFFDANHIGLFTKTDYDSGGNWTEAASQYGMFGNTSYSVDGYYRTDRGQRANNDIRQRELSGRFKQELTPKDSIYVQASYFDVTSGDVAQYYDQSSAGKTFRAKETQEPNVFLGYHHEWAPGSHTLLLAGRVDDTLTLNDNSPALLYLRTSGFTSISTNLVNAGTGSANDPAYMLGYQRELEAYSVELQHAWQTPLQTLIIGGRYQTADADTSSSLRRTNVVPSFGFPPTLVTNVENFVESPETDLYRLSFYGYEQWNVIDWLQVTAGISYDRLHYPINIDTTPINGAEDTTDRVSPKFGILATPVQNLHLRGAYTRSLGGIFFDQSIRLEPTQVGGFNQAYRSLAPESVVGLVPGTRFETYSVGLDYSVPKWGSYFLAEGEWLRSQATRSVGILQNTGFVASPFLPSPNDISTTHQALDYDEKTLLLTFNQLVSRDVAVGLRYRLTHADLEATFVDLAASVAGTFNKDVTSWLHQLNPYIIYNHPLGFFAQFDGIWSQQSNHGFTPDEPGDDFWQFNAYVGYRFLQRRAEVRAGVLNIFNHNYQLEPLTLYSELPRERTFALSAKFFF